MPEQTLPRPLRYALQALAYGAFAAILGYFSTAPAYRLRADSEAVLKLSFTHSARLAHACRERSASELAKMAPNMRTKMDCPRERSIVTVELDMDGKPLYRIDAPPTGLHRDGAADTCVARLELHAREAVRDCARSLQPVAVEVHPVEPELRELREELAGEDSLLEPVPYLGQHVLADKLPNGVADRALLVVEERVDCEEIEWVEGR